MAARSLAASGRILRAFSLAAERVPPAFPVGIAISFSYRIRRPFSAQLGKLQRQPIVRLILEEIVQRGQESHLLLLDMGDEALVQLGTKGVKLGPELLAKAALAEALRELRE